ncbi:MAG: outer membrane beta-barrel protein [Muribaculaceae bacterium]|nr:outer membrane beta-barrel protein [Muribaculaceae bacterium]
MKPIKAIVAATAVIYASANAGAASSYMFDNPENQAYFGARISLDISSAANGGGAYSNQAGFSAGAVYNIPVWTNLYFEPGLSIFYNTFGTSSWETSTSDLPQYDSNGNPLLNPDGSQVVISYPFNYQVDGSIRNFGFRIPMLVGFHFDVTEDVKVHVFTGPQLNLSLFARYYRNEVLVPEAKAPAESMSLFGTEGFKHADLQWNFGAGVTYQSYYLSLNGAWGITNMKSATTVLRRDLRRNLFAITLGYNF